MNGKVICYTLLFCLMVLVFGNKTIAEEDSTGILLLTDAVKEQNGHIEKWTLHTREKIKVQQAEMTAEKLIKLFPDWKITSNKKNGKFTFKAVLSNGKVMEKVQVLAEDSAEQSAYILYTVTVRDESQLRNFIKNKFDQKYSQIFTNSPPVYSCIAGKFDATIKEVLPNEISSFLGAVKAEKGDEVFDRDFYSLSAYSQRLSGGISLGDSTMNMQIGLRKNGLGAGTNYVIGTPIITSEY